MSRTFIIAEAGSCHNRDWELAKRLVKAAVDAGADAVKFQTYTSEDLYSRNTPNFAGYTDIPGLIKSIEMPREWHKDLKLLCDDSGIEFMSTPFDDRAVEQLVDVGVKRLKVASFEARDQRLLRCVAATKLPIIFSAGIGTDIPQVREILDVIRDVNPQASMTVLHCNSAYPTPFSDIKLGQMKLLMKEFYQEVDAIGLSDHTEGILVPPIAVALGAQVIEKHYTLDRTMKGPDHPFAIEPDELKQMVMNIRIAETVTGVKRGLSMSEYDNNMSMALRSIVLSKPIKAGQLITSEYLTTKRPQPPGSIPAHEWGHFLKYIHYAARDMDADHILTRDDVTSPWGG